MYCAGWVKNGPTGVIATTMDDAFMTADIIARDWSEGVPFIGSNEEDSNSCGKPGWEALKADVAKRGLRPVSWDDWKHIDKEEKRRGAEKGKERVKCTSVEEMLKVLDG